MTSVEKYIPPERMTEAQIMDEVDREFRRWNLLADGGCQDPGWPDGVNMNLVRNHIIYWYGLASNGFFSGEAYIGYRGGKSVWFRHYGFTWEETGIMPPDRWAPMPK